MSLKFAPFIAVVLLAAPALAQHDHPAATAAGAATDELMAAHHKMTAAMDGIQPTGDADRDFLIMMIPHHQGAIDMAEVELKYGKNPETRAMAEKIIADQKREIAEMEKMPAR
jgi:uncharacterized protein (DUF305 family)